jgi:pSer/pThr/pTyr-binding forkhead associated (FHA) protein
MLDAMAQTLRHAAVHLLRADAQLVRPIDAFRVGTVFTIGRARDNDLVFADDSVSRRHAMLRLTEDGWRILDMDSTNGTLVNGRRSPRGPLRPGDRVTVGGVNFLLSSDWFGASGTRTHRRAEPTEFAACTQVRPSVVR